MPIPENKKRSWPFRQIGFRPNMPPKPDRFFLLLLFYRISTADSLVDFFLRAEIPLLSHKKHGIKKETAICMRRHAKPKDEKDETNEEII